MRVKNLLFLLVSVWVAKQTSAQLRAEFSAPVTSGCTPLAVALTDQSTGNPDRWLWDFGDGRTSTLQNPSLLYLIAGSYTVKLTVYRGNNQSNTITKTGYINVYQFPVVNFSADQVLGCRPLPVRFANLSQAGSGTIAATSWDFGDGNTGSQNNPQHIYNQTGRYNVTLTVRNSNGCVKSTTIANYIRVYDTVKAEFSHALLPSCGAPYPVQFTNNSLGRGNLAYSWDFGDGETSNEADPLHVYRSSGVFRISLIVTNAEGCADTIPRNILIESGNYAATFNSPEKVCRGPKVKLENTTFDLGLADSVKWDFGDGSASRLASPEKSWATPGTYSIRLSVFFKGCEVNASRDISVLPGPVTQFDATPRESCKPPLQVNFSNLTTDGTVVNWDLGNGVRPAVEAPVTTYNAIGNFHVRLITKNSEGCMDTLRQANYIRIQPPRITNVPGLPYSGCLPYQQTFSPEISTSDPVVKWAWDFGDGRTSTEASPTLTYSVRGIYPINLKVTTENGCEDSFQSYVMGGNKPGIGLQAFPLLVCPLGEVFFEGTVAGPYDSLRWEFGDGGTAFNALSTIYQYQDTGYMSVRLYAYDNGCMDSLEIPNYLYVLPPIAKFDVKAVCNDPYRREFIDKAKGAETWRWDFGNGDTSDEPNPVYYFPKPGLYTVNLTVTNKHCSHSGGTQILVLDEQPEFVMEEKPTCSDNQVTFKAEGPGLNAVNIATFTWRFSDGINYVNAGPVVTRRFTENRQSDLTLEITDLNGCKRSITKKIDISIGGPKAKIIPAFRFACVGNKVIFANVSEPSGKNDIVKWTWNFGNGQDTVFTVPNFETIYADTGYYNLRLKVEDINGCVDSVFVPRGVGVFNPSAGFRSPDTLVCSNTDVRFINTSRGVGLKYLWTLGENDNSTLRDPVKKYPKNGAYDIRLEVTDTAQCKAVIFRPAYIQIGGAKALFEVSDSTASCPPLMVNFTNNSVGAINHTWDFGNGNSSVLIDPSQTYTEIGSFNARLIITGNGGCKDTLIRIISIRGPQGVIRYAPLSGCAPLKVDFQSTATNVDTYIWDFSDGMTQVTKEPFTTHTYLNPGSYRPRVILSDGQDCKVPIIGDDDVKAIGVRSLIKEVPGYVFCDSATILFADSSLTNDAIIRWKWDFGDGSFSPDPTILHTYTKPGRYTVSLLVETADNCNNITYLPGEVLIAESPEIAIGADTVVCIPGRVPFHAVWNNRDTTTLNWSWNFGNGQYADVDSPGIITYPLAGSYLAMLHATSLYGCRDSVRQEIVVNDTPNIKVAGEVITCRDADAKLSAVGASRFVWDTDPYLSCIDCANPFASNREDRKYLVTGRNGPGADCTRRDSVVVRVIQPQKLLGGQGDTLCLGRSFQIKVTGADRYQWSPPEGLSATHISNPVARPQKTTIYRVVGSDSMNCFRDTLEVPVIVYPPPKVRILNKNITGVPGSPVTIQTEASDATRWRWSPATGLSCTTCPQPEVTIAHKMTYTVMVTNPGGCTAKDEVIIHPICTSDDLFIPNTFSPNGDGRNDRFYPMGKGVVSIKSLRIFSRWGELVFERKQMNINDASAGWDGSFKGRALTPDVYVYIMEVLCFNNEIVELKGNVTLLK